MYALPALTVTAAEAVGAQFATSGSPAPAPEPGGRSLGARGAGRRAGPRIPRGRPADPAPRTDREGRGAA